MVLWWKLVIMVKKKKKMDSALTVFVRAIPYFLSTNFTVRCRNTSRMATHPS